MNTLTRGQADELISDCATLAQLLDLQHHWLGNRDIEPGDKRGHVRARLYEFISAMAWTDDTRSNGPKGSDDTGLTAP